MILPLRLRTEYSFRTAFGKLGEILELAKGAPAAAICDRHGTWGHVQWSKEAKARGIRPVFGAELAVVANVALKEKQTVNYMSFIALTQAGLVELYRLVTRATEQFYYIPRLDYSDLKRVSKNIAVLSGNFPDWKRLPKRSHFFASLGPGSPVNMQEQAQQHRFKTVAVCDNYYPIPEDRAPYEIAVGDRGRETFSWPQHILTEDEWSIIWGDPGAIARARKLLEGARADLPKGEMVHFKSTKTLRQLCVAGAKGRGVNLKDQMYKARLDRELKLITDKKFEDYFFVIADMLAYARQHMLVGPARGSSCGSLVCYLLRITEIDPLSFDLLFERFIDVNRKDLPDIDIDFPDTKRDLVFSYLAEKYGADCVARLGTVSRFKAKSTIGDVAKALSIPLFEVTDLKNSIIERSSGDARAGFCIMDTFAESDIGRRMLKKYPELRVAERIEDHARHSGQHAAGVIITARPVHSFCSVDARTGAAMIDKADAEVLDLLKIDALGLRTLTILQETLEAIGWPHEKLLRYPIDDQRAFDVINRKSYAGIFQFEGQALQRIAKIVTVDSFEVITALTALARPGPLISGGTDEFIKRKERGAEITYIHPIVESITRVTYGTVIYQEQVMQIAREVGGLSWEDVSSLRKAMSKSMGKEFFDKYFVEFNEGALAKGLTEAESKNLWESINTMGSWAFNRSHAVAYGMISYWCAVLKAYHPLEFAAATLRHSKDETQTLTILRELETEGYAYKAVDAELSEDNWSVKGGKLIGGLTNIRGIGAKKAERILAKRRAGEPLTPAERRALEAGATPFDQLYETDVFWGHIKRAPAEHNVFTRILNANQIIEGMPGEFVFIGKLKVKNPRDLNELINVQLRKGKKAQGPTKYLNMTFEDDTGQVFAGVSVHRFARIGQAIVDNGNIGDWYMLKGTAHPTMPKILITKVRKLDPRESPAFPAENPQEAS